MSLVTLEYPVANLPGLPMQDGQRFDGIVHGGKLHLTLHESAPEPTQSDPGNQETAVERFVKKWHGQGQLLQAEETEQDPRLAYLTAKHVH
jgi:hypothetical protein